jgi:hypothetical protein
VIKWSFFGRVLPERIPITWPGPFVGSAEDALGWNYNFRIAIHHSQIVADIEVTKGDPDIFSVRNVAEHWVMFIDAVGYQGVLSRR